MMGANAYGGVSIAVVAIMCVATFSMGAATGVQAATNESASLETATDAVEDIPANVRENVTANTTGFEQELSLRLTMPPVHAAVWTSKVGMQVGYAVPLVGRVIATAGPVTMIVGTLGYLVVLTRRLLRQTGHT